MCLRALSCFLCLSRFSLEVRCVRREFGAGEDGRVLLAITDDARSGEWKRERAHGSVEGERRSNNATPHAPSFLQRLQCKHASAVGSSASFVCSFVCVAVFICLQSCHCRNSINSSNKCSWPTDKCRTSANKRTRGEETKATEGQRQRTNVNNQQHVCVQCRRMLRVKSRSACGHQPCEPRFLDFHSHFATNTLTSNLKLCGVV